MENSLLKWINTFDVASEIGSLVQLGDGVVLYRILHQIAPDSFEIGSVIEDVSDNLILKTKNVKKLLKAIETYYQTVLIRDCREVSNIDAASVASGNSESITSVLQLVLGCAVQCDGKEKYIQKMLSLDVDAKNDL
eukprot:CAMPEP_0113700984 /NCGR_PEP_ID=MMETSP0038_2-20120614/24298_1 /TAXON_ID=2898 /ORGANISM="Cryptomonas paramecium" /LENGTH=135 /DNA_ID=CAMNT_0000624777 /DNA_START=47 /DNA_END=450 /DNA_ORIENTATION=+ /assembly_acc=CAM_ASM_000170